MFWFGSQPPTNSDSDFFKGVSQSVETLTANNREIEREGKAKNIRLVEDQYAEGIVQKLSKQHGVKNGFFYNVERVQLILVVKMLFNHCRVSKTCSNKAALSQANQFVEYAKNQTSAGRDNSKRQSIDDRNDILLLAIVGGLAAATIKGISEGLSNSEYSSLPANPTCRVGDSCYSFIRTSKHGSAIIQCVKGPSTGKEKCLSFKESTGKYATGCGISDIGAHHYSFSEAADRACLY